MGQVLQSVETMRISVLTSKENEASIWCSSDLPLRASRIRKQLERIKQLTYILSFMWFFGDRQMLCVSSLPLWFSDDFQSSLLEVVMQDWYSTDSHMDHVSPKAAQGLELEGWQTPHRGFLKTFSFWLFWWTFQVGKLQMEE